MQSIRNKVVEGLLTKELPKDNPNPAEYLMKLSNTDERPPNKECS